MDETKLLRKVCQGNQKAFEQIMEHPDREIFLRHYYYYQTVTCIADEMKLSPSSIKSRLARGRQKLKKYLHKGGYFDEDNRMDG